MIVIYGKGGICKSTTTSNLSAALYEMGLRVMQIGCDPKANSTKILMNGIKIQTVLDGIKSRNALVFGDSIFQGFNSQEDLKRLTKWFEKSLSFSFRGFEVS